MRRRSRAGGEPVKTRRRKTLTLKRRDAPKTARRRGTFAAGLNKKVALFKRERDEAIEQQRATSEVLRAISNSPTDAASTLGAIAKSVARLLDVTDAEIMSVEGNMLRCVAKHGRSRQWPVGTARLLTRDWVTGRAVIDRTIVQVADLQAPNSGDSCKERPMRASMGIELHLQFLCCEKDPRSERSQSVAWM